MGHTLRNVHKIYEEPVNGIPSRRNRDTEGNSFLQRFKTLVKNKVNTNVRNLTGHAIIDKT